MSELPGLIDKRFECTGEIGSGTDSIVYRGTDRKSGDPVAVKILTAEPALALADLSRELGARERFDSPAVVPIIAHGTLEAEGGRRYYFVTPLLEGEDLEAKLEGGALSESEAIGLMKELTRALQPIHEAGLFHSDLKPSNIFFTADGELKLLDFGLARGFQRGGTTGGTASYAAPEQLLGQACDARADLYSLGCIFYEIVTGSPPFEGKDMAEVLFDQVNAPPVPPIQRRTQLSAFTNAVILTLLRKSPEDRFSSALELEQALEAGESGAWWADRVAQEAGDSSETRGSWRPSRPWQVPLVGRESELQRLRGRVEDSIERSTGRMIAVRGPAGVGKTRLVEEVLVGLDGDAFILASRCIKFDTRVPYLALIGLVDDLRRRGRFDSARLQRFLTRHLPQTPLLVPRFMEFLTKQAPVESGPGALTTDNLLYLFTALFHHLAEELPVVLFIDDLHWAEPSTCNFLRYFVRNISDVPLVLLGGCRPEELAATGESELPLAGTFSDLATEPNFETVDLAPLTAKESHELVRLSCGQAVGDELALPLYRRTEGNPYYLFESIILLRQDGVILGEGAESRVASSVTEISIPSTVADLLKSRLKRLSDADRELLGFASIQGPTFRSDRLAQEGDDRLELLRRLARIEREHGVIRSREAGYAFDHHLLHEYIYRSIAPELRAAYHRDAAERIAESATDLGEETVYTLADHYSRGGDNPRAVEYLLKAAQLSMAKYSGTEALETLERARKHFRALPTSERSADREWDFALLQAEIAAHLGDHAMEEAAVEELKRLAESFGTPERALDAAEHRAAFAVRVSRFDEALEQFTSAGELARGLGDTRRLAELSHRIGTTYREMMRWDDAMRFLDEALELARPTGEEHLVGCILKDIGTVKTKLTRWEEAAGDYRAALPLLREAGDRREEAWALNGLAVSLFCAGNQEDALECWEEAGKVFESIGYPSGRSNILHNLGVTYSNRGEIDRALECLRSALHLRQSIGMRHAQVSTLTRLGFIYFLVGAYDRAAEHLRSALSIARDIGAQLGCIEMYYWFTELALAQNDLDAAADHLEQAWKMLGDSTDPYHVGPLVTVSGRLALARKDWKGAASHLAKATEMEAAKEGGPSGEVLAYQAWAEQEIGDSEEAESLLKRYEELDRPRPFIYERIKTDHALSLVHDLRGEVEKRDAALERLREDLERIDRGLSDEALREAFYGRWGRFLE